MAPHGHGGEEVGKEAQGAARRSHRRDHDRFFLRSATKAEGLDVDHEEEEREGCTLFHHSDLQGHVGVDCSKEQGETHSPYPHTQRDSTHESSPFCTLAYLYPLIFTPRHLAWTFSR